MVGHRQRLYLVGGKGDDGSSLRCVHILDLATGLWSRGPDLGWHRWYFGLVRVGGALYAVGGCGQLDSVEAWQLDDDDTSGWVQKASMGMRRHLPGVGAMDGCIYVVGRVKD